LVTIDYKANTRGSAEPVLIMFNSTNTERLS